MYFQLFFQRDDHADSNYLGEVQVLNVAAANLKDALDEHRSAHIGYRIVAWRTVEEPDAATGTFESRRDFVLEFIEKRLGECEAIPEVGFQAHMKEHTGKETFDPDVTMQLVRSMCGDIKSK